jgi:pyruvate/2-oxoglutarate dehydrogenase complex dihydrolipoamide acyltransferase (E2) component
MSMFSQPAAGGGFFKPAEANGHLVLITTVHEIVKRFDQLRNEEIDQAVVDVVDLDTPDQELRERINVTHKGIVSRLTAGGGMVLGRIGQVATSSGFQAWALLPFVEGSDDVRAGAWVTAHQPTFTQAAAPAPAPAAAAPQPAAPAAQYTAPAAAPAPAAQQYAAPAPAPQQGDEPPF